MTHDDDDDDYDNGKDFFRHVSSRFIRASDFRSSASD